MTLLFQRKAAIRVGELLVETDGAKDLRVEFDIKKNPQLKHPNEAELKIYNLAEKTRRLLDLVPGHARREVRTIAIEAGYKGEIGLLFSGEVLLLQSARERTGWTTTVTARAGRTASQAIISETASAGQTNADLMQSILGAIERHDPFIAIKRAKDLAAKRDYAGALDQVVKSVTMTGSAMDQLKRLSSRVGLEVWIDDDELQLVKTANALNLEAVVLGPDSGLIGVPDRVHDDKRPTAIVVRGMSLLNAKITIGRRIILESESLKGAFVVREVQHQGDSHGATWYTAFEAIQKGTTPKDLPPQISQPATYRAPPA